MQHVQSDLKLFDMFSAPAENIDVRNVRMAHLACHTFNRKVVIVQVRTGTTHGGLALSYVYLVSIKDKPQRGIDSCW